MHNPFTVVFSISSYSNWPFDGSSLVFHMCTFKETISDFKKESGPKWTVLKVDGRAKNKDLFKNGRSLAKTDGHLCETERSRAIVDGLFSQIGRSWVKVDVIRLKVDAPNESKD